MISAPGPAAPKTATVAMVLFDEMIFEHVVDVFINALSLEFTC